MTPLEFIQENLSILSKQFPSVNIKYGYNNLIKTHIVVLSPEEEFLHNDQLDDAWIPLSFNFKSSFPDEEIAFVPPSSTLAIIEVLEEFNPAIMIVLDCIYSELFEYELKYSFPQSIISPTSVVSRATIHNSIAMLNYPEQFLVNDATDNIYQSAA